jgi:uncharacterized membrane protein
VAMTRGYKLHIFELGLSFVGWYLLGFLCLLIGAAFIPPYYEATFAEAYIFMRARAL